jgi:carbonic anhydrase
MLYLQHVKTTNDILPEYRNTPIGELLEYHNLGKPLKTPLKPQLLVGMCMDYRKNLRIPEKFAFIMRAGGANFQGKEFNIAFAIGVKHIKYFVIIGHDHCGMSNIGEHRNDFIEGMIQQAGWTKETATEYFDKEVGNFDIGDEAKFTLKEVNRLKELYPGIVIAPLFYLVSDNSLSQIIES